MERTINWPRTIRIGTIITARGAIVITGVDKFGPWTGGSRSPVYSHLRFFVPMCAGLKYDR
jgi:hypothetical protein